MTDAISLTELRSAFERVLRKLEEAGVTELRVRDDPHYWCIGLDEIEINGVPYNFVGSLAALIAFIGSGPTRKFLSVDPPGANLRV